MKTAPDPVDGRQDLPECTRLAQDIPAMAGPAVVEKFRQFGSLYRWMLLCTMLVGSMSTMLAATTINVALPAIIGAFGLGQDQAQWLSTAFLASSTIAMLANAWAMTVFGPRTTYIAGMSVFVAGSLLGAISTSLELLIISRALQGVAAGLLQPMSMFLIFQTFPDRRRGTAMGVFSIGVVLAPAFGPALGGVAVDLASWRLVFVTTLPLAFLALGFAPLLLPRADRNPNLPRPPLDWPGLVLLAIAVVSLLAAFAGGNRDGWDSDATLARFLTGMVAAIIFFIWERRHPFPALNPKIFTYRQFWSAGIIISATGLAIYGSTYLIPIFVQLVQGYSPTSAGVMMIPAGIAMVIGFPLAGRLSDRVDARWLLLFGIICFGAASLLLAQVSSLTPYWTLAGWIILSRIGISFCMPPSNTTAVRAVPPHLLGAATGGVSFLMQVGGAFGVNMLAILLQRRMIFHADHLSSGMQEHNHEMLYWHAIEARELELSGAAPVQSFHAAFGMINQFVANEAMVFAFRDCFLAISLWFALLPLILMLMPARVRPPAA